MKKVTVTITGESGVGKSRLALLISDLLRENGFSATFNDVDTAEQTLRVILDAALAVIKANTEIEVTTQQLAKEDIVWEAKADHRFECKVIRKDDYTGVLTVVDSTDNKTLLTENVDLSYSALFGPDIADVHLWENMCMTVIYNI